jgi:glycosyltransferase involved in cell wall biosynthesis
MNSHRFSATVGVVIPVYDDWPGLQRCLAALACQTYPRELLRLRVVNNGSSDWPADPAFPLPVDVLHHRRPGSYGARNRAALGWAVDVLAFTDADCEPTPHWIEQGVRSLVAADERAVLSAGRIVLTAICAQAPTAAEQLDQILGFDQERTVRRAGFGVTANLFVPQAVFAELGGFHAHTRSGGDRDFCQRARLIGVPVVYAPSAEIRHPARDWQSLLLKQRRIVGGRLALAAGSPLGALQALFGSVRPVWSESWRVIRSSRFTLLRRCHLLVLVWILRGAVLLEWFRLMLPAQQALR